MEKDRDYADSEVKGISRYIPTNLSKGILLLLPSAFWLAFSSIREHPDWFGLEAWSSLEKTLLAALAAAVICIILVIILVIDMAVAIHQSKHRRVIHYSNKHPLMSFRFIMQNSTIMHWLILGVICVLFFVTGYIYAKL